MLLFDFEQLCDDLQQYKEIVIYGTGYMANVIKREVDLRGMKIAFCIVSQRPEERLFNDIPVYCLTEVSKESLQNTNTVLFIAALEEANKSIEIVLSAAGITGYRRLIDYHISSSHMKEVYEHQTEKEWVSHIQKWYQSEHAIDGLGLQQIANVSQGKMALLVVANISPRFFKIAKALKDNGFRVECLLFGSSSAHYFSLFTKNQIGEKLFDTTYIIDKLVDLLFYVTWRMRASFIYLFSQVFDYEVGATFAYLIAHKEGLSAPLVFEQYDVGAYYLDIISNENLALEKYCIENADYVCDRAFEIQHMMETKAFCIKGKRIQLMDGCCGLALPPIRLHDRRPLSLCYGGGISLEEEWPDIGCTDILADICEENRCHLHIYPSFAQWEACEHTLFRKFILRDKESEYFHFHVPIAYEELIRAFTCYDFGIMYTRKELPNVTKWGYNKIEKNTFGATNKIFDYLDAGIPVISAFPRKIIEFLSRFGVVISASIEDYDFEYFKFQRDVMRVRVLGMREKLSMNRLIRGFLQTVLSDEYKEGHCND